MKTHAITTSKDYLEGCSEAILYLQLPAAIDMSYRTSLSR